MRSPLKLAVVMTLPLAVTAIHADDERSVQSDAFTTCEEAAEAVRGSGKTGMQFDRDPDRVYDDTECYYGYLGVGWSVWEKHITIAGERCFVGYQCLQSGGASVGG